MPLIKKPMRYAHPEGHTDVCYFTGKKRDIITCGSDGDVRSWLNIMDDDPNPCCVAEQVLSVISKNEKIYVGTDNNRVQILSYPDLDKEGIVTRFGAPVSALATAKNSNIIVSGGCDMNIQVTNIATSDNITLDGHSAPVLGLSLDPCEEFVASSSADGTLRVWNIKEKSTAHIWNNVIPKCNSFFSAKAYGVPSFNPVDGSCLAYPCAKDIIIVERSTWKELFHLKSAQIKSDISICKFSECGTFIAASTLFGEVIVWDVMKKESIGYVEHQQKAKITSLCWHIDKPDEIAFCDFLGQLGCIDVIVSDEESTNQLATVGKEDVENDNAGLLENENDDNGENVISINKIKSSVDMDDDQKSQTDAFSEKSDDKANVIPEFNLQPPFQPGSSPEHLLSYFMVWNDTGMVRCFTAEDGDESSIEVEFHDATIHRSIHMNNYLRHTIAALSPQALALNCPTSNDTCSKLVVVVLQGWGSGNKEWTMDLPEDEEGECIAAGDNFVALATSTRYLRLFTVTGTQREIIAIPGPVVAMNGSKSDLVVAYHNGIGGSNDQCMSLLLIGIRGLNIHSRTLCLPLTPLSELAWLGLSDLGSPVIMDTDDVIKVYDKKSLLWRVTSNMNNQSKGKADHYFIIGISEEQSIARCVLCKGSRYPPTTPRPVIAEVPLSPPLCELESEKTQKELTLCKLKINSTEKDQAVLALIAYACRSNVEYRAIELCEQFASEAVLELAIKYAQRTKQMALSKKIESIADTKEKEAQVENETKHKDNENENGDMENNADNNIFDTTLSLTSNKKPDIEIKPLLVSDSLSMKRNNPFLKSGNFRSAKGLAGLETTADKPQKSTIPTAVPKTKTKESKDGPKKETFISWYSKNKKFLQEEFPEKSSTELTTIALARYKEENTQNNDSDSSESKKRKLSPESENSNEPKRTSNKILSSFAFEK